ncbi:fungal-specific transcription factor domain-containing protein [Fusarium flagelliforme]|nr:fungal-specific transcription factor domain-containing protein [Fusarium flagelliforme]KAH7192919.1 fungal-specific transcription factor domain-containing protein [Fusarium flagelliforme]
MPRAPSIRPTARRKDPACGTCRKKCRKCDRKRPICDRCRIKGLPCEGYPPRFQFQENLTVSPDTGTPQVATPDSTVEQSVGAHQSPQDSWSGYEPFDTDLSSFHTEEVLFGTSGFALPSPPSIDMPELMPDLSPIHFSSMPVSFARTADIGSDLESDITINQHIISHFDFILSEQLAIQVPGSSNPFREYVLPLAYQHQGVLHALLGLSLSHMDNSGLYSNEGFESLSMGYRLSATRSVASLSLKDEMSGLTHAEEEYLLAMVLLLVLHDVYLSAVTSHGGHLDGASSLCKRIVTQAGISSRSKTVTFLTSALAWLDILHGFTSAGKLSFSEQVREYVHDHGSLHLHTLAGCPSVLFSKMGQIFDAGKSFLIGDILRERFEQVLETAERFLQSWDAEQALYPTVHHEWKQLAEAYRHACLLRLWRLPEPFEISCDDSRIQVSVAAILDICAVMPRDNAFYKHLLIPLLLSRANARSPHQVHYASSCIEDIKRATGFQYPAMTETWEERRRNVHGFSNMFWREFESPPNSYL